MNPIDILLDPVSLIVLAIYGGLMIWEALFPGRQLPPIKNWKIRGLASFFFFFYLSTYLPMFWDTFFSQYQIFDVAFLGTYVGALIAVMVYELGVYFWHRAMHRSDRLWKMFHQMHHSAERLDSYGAFYFSPWDMIGWTLLGSICMVMVVGLTPQAATLALLTTTFLGMFQHTNIRTPQWLGYLIQRPESHTVHHAKGVHAYNYSDLPIYDILFGTFKNPSNYEYETGFYDGASKRVWEMIQGKDIAHPRQIEKKMKVLVTLLLIISASTFSIGQTINYQGALRGFDDSILSRYECDLRVSFFDGSQKVFEETHEKVMTNSSGIFNIKIGSINTVEFQAVDFSSDLEIQTEIETANGYEIVSYENFSAVPMAMHAKTVENPNDADADPSNELQRISFDPINNRLTLTHGGEVDLSTLDNDPGGSSTGTDDQKLSISGTSLSIEDGNSVNLAVLQDGVEDADADPENEIQRLTLNKDAKQITLSNGGGTVDLNQVIESGSSPWVLADMLLTYPGYVSVGTMNVDGGAINVGGDLKITNDGLQSKDAMIINSHPESSVLINTNNGGRTTIGRDKDVVLAEGSGMIGIGVNSPSSKLHIESNGDLANDGIVKIGQGGNFLLLDGHGIQSKNGGIILNPNGGNVGIGSNGPKSKLHIRNGYDAGLNRHGYLMLGSEDERNIVFDNNEIQARNNGQPASLVINQEGGWIYCPGLRQIGDHANMQFNVSSGEIGYETSSRRYKTNINALSDDWKKVLKARPVRYDRPDSPSRWEYGYIAEEMDSIGLSNLVFYDENGLPENFNYEKMTLYLTEVLKIHEEENANLRKNFLDLQSKLVDLEAKIEKLN